MLGNVSIWLAFAAGLLSFISPCTLPLFPSYLGYISGVSLSSPGGLAHSGSGTQSGVEGAKSAATGSAVLGQSNQPMTPRYLRWRAFTHSLAFCVGLSTMFVILGFGATALGSLLIAYRSDVRVVGGILVVLMGLFMAGVIRLGWLMRERRIQLPRVKPLGYIGSVVVGIVFAAGWTPCIGPILGAVLTMVVTHPSIGRWYMVLYGIGFSIPFLVLAVTLASVRPLLRYTERVAKIGGWLMVVMGLLLATNRMTDITIWIQQVTGFSGF